MNILDNLKLEIKETSAVVLIYWCMCLIFVFMGWLLFNLNPPNYQIGLPMTALGFAFFVFGTSVNISNKSAKKTDLILKKLEDIHEELRKKK